MEDRYRGVTTSLTLVTMAALLVAFGASVNRRNLGGELISLEEKVQELSATNIDLQAQLRLAQGRTAEFRSVSRELNQALYQEQIKSLALEQKLNRRQRQVARQESVSQVKD